MEHLRPDDPETIGPYRLFARLGQGGWGTVYFARSPYGAGVALKTIHPHLLAGNPELLRRRFAREVRAARTVVSEYTATLVEADPHATEPWFATTFIRGVDLPTALEQCEGPLPERTWRVAATGLVDALGAVHAAGLVHRDLKPGNILLAGTRPYVVDFGIARHLTLEDGTTLTGNADLGTLNFAAPELLRKEPVDSSCDVFSLGLVLAYAALGRHPFGPGSELEISWNIVRGRPDLRGLAPTVERVVRPCLEPDPADRPGLAELAGLLPAAVSPDEQEWLPRPLWRVLEDRSALAINLRAPLRLPGRERGPDEPWGADSSPEAGAWTPVPAPPRSDPGAGGPDPEGPTVPPGDRRPGRHEPSAAPPGRPDGDDITLPPHAPGPAAARGATAAAATMVKAAVTAPAAAPAAAATAPTATAPTETTAARPAAAKAPSTSAGARNDAAAVPPAPANPPATANPPGTKHLAAARAGDSEAMRLVARAQQATGDQESALQWLLRSAAAGNPTGAYQAAELIQQSFPKQRHRLVDLYRSAAEGGVREAPARLGELLEQDRKQSAEAPHWYAKAAALGDDTAAKAVARLRGGAPHVPPSVAELALLGEHQLPAVQGSLHSMLILGSWYQNAALNEPALHWYARAADTGNAHAMLLAAQLLAQDPAQEATALEWYRRAARAGNTAAMHVLGRRWREKGDIKAALNRFQAAAEKGHRPSMVEAAELLEQEQQPDRALEWYRRAAAKGDQKAVREAERLGSAQARTAAPAAGKTAPAPAAKRAASAPAPVPTPAPAPAPAPAAKKAAPKKSSTQQAGAATVLSAAKRRQIAHLCESALAREEQGRLEGALQQYLRAEAMGDRTAKREAARLSVKLAGKGKSAGRQKLRQRGLSRYRELAADGDRQSLRALEELARAGDVGVALDLARLDPQNARRWLLVAVDAGNAPAMRALGQNFIATGTEEDFLTGLDWLRRAGERQITSAILDGARALEQRGDFRAALDWYRRAADRGNATAAKRLSRLEAKHPGTAFWIRLSDRWRRPRG
ncbi:serine/threonine-protein kinase [Kitasatospora terrestris]|uniref:Protein kinase domain-containing protein n=1 Tax=Kitasatospora terrestris TaxID=258051 RepID=A0ABP9D812_9ACTN